MSKVKNDDASRPPPSIILGLQLLFIPISCSTQASTWPLLGEEPHNTSPISVRRDETVTTWRRRAAELGDAEGNAARRGGGDMRWLST